jgi:hypothetical protein
MMPPMDDSAYQKRMKAMQAALEKISEKTNSKAAKAAVVERTGERKLVCDVVHELVDESLEMYENGEMDFEEMVKDLVKALESIDLAMLKELEGEEPEDGEEAGEY